LAPRQEHPVDLLGDFLRHGVERDDARLDDDRLEPALDAEAAPEPVGMEPHRELLDGADAELRGHRAALVLACIDGKLAPCGGHRIDADGGIRQPDAALAGHAAAPSAMRPERMSATGTRASRSASSRR